ncbi:hypothetical protein M758_3G027900 [Ceratodon purpureus]|nr:hypothetical protein M758_3G027900 [Ceratodon purpureus]
MENEWKWSLERRWSVGMLMAVVVAVQAMVGNVVQVAAAQGVWRVVSKNVGITAMHAAVTPVTGNVVLLHQSNNGPSNMTFPDGRCKLYPNDRFLPVDCYVHSVILDPNSGVVRPLFIQTDTQCSSGQFLADGQLGQTGGDREGAQVIRNLARNCFFVTPINTICDWVEGAQKLNVGRWYATNQLLPDGRQIIVGGRGQPSYEYSPPSANSKAIPMDFLKTSADVTTSATDTNNIYPYVHLLPTTGYLYIFANRDSIIFDYINNVVIRKFPKIPGNPRNYPSAGSSVMLPLKWQDNFQTAEVLVCGGATSMLGNQQPQALCSVTCGRIQVTTANSKWKMESMPIPRCMGDMILLPDMNVLIINGARRGLQGWGMQSEPTLNPVLYAPKKTAGQRFSVMTGTVTPRVYHSTANLLTDGSVMVAGSNTNEFYTFIKTNKWWPPVGRWWPTELSVEAFTPPYAQTVAGGRPRMLSPANGSVVKLNSVLQLGFWDDISPKPATDTFLFTLSSPPFSTHSFSQGQRLVSIKSLSITTLPGGRVENGVSKNLRTANLQIPADVTVLPPAYYMLWVVKNGNPSKSCLWIQITK